MPSMTTLQEAALYVCEGEDNVMFDIHPSGKWSRRAFHILRTPAYHVFNLCVCTLLLLVALVEHPSAIPPHIHPTVKTTIFAVSLLRKYNNILCCWKILHRNNHYVISCIHHNTHFDM